MNTKQEWQIKTVQDWEFFLSQVGQIDGEKARRLVNAAFLNCAKTMNDKPAARYVVTLYTAGNWQGIIAEAAS